ncbi:hypothetical protein PLEI_1463 [Photobacterium leiognathi lrivu.4.1]|uniref:Uncharacterized protein n=1 Tax=Photobacterium leiognathi lrivu.4.1 TaxID=1248232 RepID=A0A0U1P5G4_PHOLE|nr:hypothetical protein [Photobacterium leiognathi]GAD29810.1 hypothetical protein PLEI_1463 [Photobacterium leiognathi lrivu.4.1]
MDYSMGLAPPVPQQNSPHDPTKSAYARINEKLFKMGEKQRLVELEKFEAMIDIALGQPYQSGSATSAIEGDMQPLPSAPIEKAVEGIKCPIERANVRQSIKSLAADMKRDLMKQGG